METFSGLHQAKLQEIEATKEAILSKKSQKAKADTTAGHAKKDLEDSQVGLEEDEA